jgi:uncharacterized membrane protein
MNKTMLLAGFILLLAADALASGIDIYSDTETVFMGRNDSMGVQLTLENTGDETQCVELSAETDSSYVEAEPSIDSVCLNKNGKTSVTLSIRTIDAPASSYFTATFAVGDTALAFYTITVKTVSEPEIELIPYESDICRGEQDYFSVLVRNNSNELKRIRLWADNEMLLPYFEPREIVLDSYDEEYAKVYVHAGRSTLLGDHTISLFAETASEQAKKVATIDVKDCLGEEIDFLVEFSGGCEYAVKGEEESVSYTVRNLSDEELSLRVAVESTLPTDYDSSIQLEGNERKTFRIGVTPRASDEAGRHDLTLIVWDSGRSEEKTKCIYVRESEASEVELLNNNLSIEQCLNEVFTLLVKNTGDTELDYRISVIDDFDTINVTVSDRHFELDSGEQKEVYIAVTTSEETLLGEYEFDVVVRYNGESITKTLEFEVVGKLPEREQDLEIASHPLQVKVVKGSETSFLVGITNNSSNDLGPITVQVTGLPPGAFAPSVKNLSLEAGQSRSVQLYIDAASVAEGTYVAVVEARTAEFKASEEIEFIVEEEAEEAGEENVFLAGMISAGSSALLGLAALVIVIALILLIGKGIRGNSGKNKDAWLRGE